MSGNVRRVVLRRRPMETLAGMGDYAEPAAFPIAPGSLRSFPPGTREAAYANPLQVSQGATDEARQFQWTRETPFDAWDAFAYIVGATNAIRIDLPLRRPRRAVLVTNTSLAANVWIGPSESVRVNGGQFIPPQGNVSLPLNENCQVFAIASAAGTVVSICQFV